MANEINGMSENYNVPASVRTVHVLLTGELIYSREEYERVKERFSWVDQHFILSEVLRLRRLTDTGKQSVIAIYENGHLIKPFHEPAIRFSPERPYTRQCVELPHVWVNYSPYLVLQIEYLILADGNIKHSILNFKSEKQDFQTMF